MLFNQLTAYNIQMPNDEADRRIVLNPKEWRAFIGQQAMGHSFKALTDHQPYGSGWEVPEPEMNQEYLISVPGNDQNIHLLCYRTDERKIPNSAINEQLKRQVEKIEREEKREVSKLERRTFKDEIIAQKIPHTLPTPSRVLVVFDLDNKTVLIGTSSEGNASCIKAAISEQLLPEYEVDENPIKARLLPPVFCKADARDHMTRWLTCENDEMPTNVCLSDSVVLQRDKSKNIAITGQGMDSPYVREALNDGYRAFKVPVSIMSGDIEMGCITLDKYGAFNKIDIPNEFKPTVDKDNEDAAWNLLYAELAGTALNYKYVADVVMGAFGTGDTLDGVLARVAQSAAQWAEGMRKMGGVIVAPGEGDPVDLSAKGLGLLKKDPENEGVYLEAVAHVRKSGKVSISSLQRHLRIGYDWALRVAEALEKNGIVSSPDSAGTRTVYATETAQP